jgi:hypothetical protein
MAGLPVESLAALVPPRGHGSFDCVAARLSETATLLRTTRLLENSSEHTNLLRGLSEYIQRLVEMFATVLT